MLVRDEDVIQLVLKQKDGDLNLNEMMKAREANSWNQGQLGRMKVVCGTVFDRVPHTVLQLV